MAYVDFVCEDCDKTVEVYFQGLVPEKYEKPPCRSCGKEMRRVISVPQIEMTGIQDWRYEGYNVGLGKQVQSKTDAMSVAKAKGLVPVGNDDAPAMIPQRQENVARGQDRRSWESRVGENYVREAQQAQMQQGDRFPRIGGVSFKRGKGEGGSPKVQVDI